MARFTFKLNRLAKLEFVGDFGIKEVLPSLLLGGGAIPACLKLATIIGRGKS
ncbi:unnamed protein product [marine sediment metagenome]|uniref:Uncharacterized protein n=1 Tax=marine sediment metagenome TaxID=412755 RepID=X1H603_9ZZZZ